MSPALVSAGAVAYGNPNFTGQIAPAYGQAPGIGSLLVACMYSGSSNATDPFTCTTPGWVETPNPSGVSFDWASIWYKADSAGGDVAPVFGVTNTTTTAGQLMEFSGMATSSPLDQSGPTISSGATVVATNTAPDTTPGGLVVFASGFNGGSGSTTIVNTGADSSGAALSFTSYNNPTDTTGFKYNFGWAPTSPAVGAGKDTVTAQLGVFSNSGACIISFLPGSSGPTVSVVPVSPGMDGDRGLWKKRWIYG